MGFNTDIVNKTNTLNQETLQFLNSRPELSNALINLILKIREIDRRKNKLLPSQRKVKVKVGNYKDGEIHLNVIGINSNSLISSEIEGNIAFTFIKNLDYLEIIQDKYSASHISKNCRRTFKLIKNKS